MIKVACDYNIKEDIGFILESEKINNIEFAERAKVSRTTLEGIVKKGIARDDVCEKIYAYAYNNKYRINSVKEELIKKNTEMYYFMALRRVCQKYQFLIRGRTVTLEKDFIWGRHIIKHCRLYVKKKNLVCIRLDIRFWI